LAAAASRGRAGVVVAEERHCVWSVLLEERFVAWSGLVAINSWIAGCVASGNGELWAVAVGWRLAGYVGECTVDREVAQRRHSNTMNSSQSPPRSK
jgi:hypothetical protein